MMPSYHPDADLLVSYAAGSMAEPVALLVATHLALCPECRAEVERLEGVGGVLLEQLESVPVNDGSLERLLDRLGDSAIEDCPPPRVDTTTEPRVPQPLRGYLGTSLDALPWQSFRGLEKVELLSDRQNYRTRLMRIKAGTAMPLHSHEGSELTLVLAGGFSDHDGHYLPGDFATADPSVNHRPVADPGEDCLCLAVTDAPLRLTGPFGRLLNPFLRI